MVTSPKKMIAVVFLSTCMVLSGCSSMVKSTVNTQPIVDMEEADYLNPDAIVQGKAVFYEPAQTGHDSELDKDLARFSPVLVQGFQPAGPEGKKNKYDYWQDGIGSPYLINKGKDVRINTDKPTLYCRVEQAQVYGQKLKQLVYVWWYPSRPVGSIEKGQVDGNILRITLDRDSHPVVFEYSQTCGCYHGVFASEQLESLAAEEFSEPLKGKRFALENKQAEKADWVIRDLIDVQPDRRLFVYVSAGKHFGKALRFMDAAAINPDSRKAYSLAEYESLVRIPTDGGGTASMFNDDGLVKGAKRSGEEFMMADLDHPGWPRHLDRMLIHWDQDRWSDPKLLEEALRVPHKAVAGVQVEIAQKDEAAPAAIDKEERIVWSDPKLFEQTSRIPSKAVLDSQPDTPTTAHVIEKATPSESAGEHDLPDQLYNTCSHDKPILVLVSHKYCLGCQAFKKQVLPQPDVQKELGGWDFISLDMFVKEQMTLAKPLNITLTPTIICFDSQGRELRRIEGIDSKEQLLKFIAGRHSTG